MEDTKKIAFLYSLNAHLIYQLFASFLDSTFKLMSWHVGLASIFLDTFLSLLGKQGAHATMPRDMLVALWLFLIHCLENIWTLSIPSVSCHKCTAFQAPTGTSFIDNKLTKVKRWWKCNHNCLSYKKRFSDPQCNRKYISFIKSFYKC